MAIDADCALVIGAGGLLGRSVLRAAGPIQCRTVREVPWHDPAARRDSLRDALLEFLSWSQGRRTHLIWVAGTAGVSSSEPEAASELEAFSELIEDAADAAPDSIFLASSAGAVYAIGTPPFNSSSPTQAISAYGRAKLQQEQVAATMADRSCVVIGRITNLYGPNPGRRIGLVNRLCAAAATRQPVNLFVPLDTIRDYLFVDDAASLIWRSLLARREPGLHIDILGSGRPVTVAAVVATVQEVAHRKVPLALGSDPSALLQPADTRVDPSWPAFAPEFDPIDLAVGVQRVLTDLVTEQRYAG